MSIIIGGEQMSRFYCREDELRDTYPEVLPQEVVSLPDALSRIKDKTGQKFLSSLTNGMY